MAKRSSLVSLSVFIGCAALFAGTARAEIFPSSSGDVADPIQWGGTYAETMTLPASFSLNAGTYYFSSNVTFASGYDVNGRKNPTLDQREHPGVVVKFGPMYSSQRYSGVSVTFRGGIYDLMGKYLDTYRGGDEEAAFNGVVTFSDGVLVTNISSITQQASTDWRMLGGTTYPTTLNIDTNARLFTQYVIMGTGEGFWCLLNVKGGGELHVADWLKTSNNENVNGNRGYKGYPRETLKREGRHHVLVDGEGSLLDVGGNFWCGTRYFNDSLTVSNGGVTKVGGVLYTGYAGASNIAVTVTGAGSALNVAGDFRVANGANASSNTVVVKDGATLEVGALNVGVGSGATKNVVEIRDGATVKTTSLKVGVGGSAFGNALVFSGANTTVDIKTGTSWAALTGGKNNRLTFTDGVTWTNMTAKDTFWFPIAGTSNTLEVTERSPATAAAIGTSVGGII